MRALSGALSSVVVAALVVASAASAPAQRGGFVRGPSPRHYDGRFTFARLKFPLCMGNCLYYYGLPPWEHGYPRAEDNMLQILDAITSIHPRVDDSVIVSVDDPEMFKYPVSYMTEASFWVLREPERQTLNQYLLKGGFIIFDDFRNDYNRGSGGLPNLESNLERIIPGAHLLPMSPADPIFHSFFEIDSFDAISQYYDFGRPEILGLYEHNDRQSRLMAVVNFNTDISNFWEFSGTGEKPIDESNRAYKLGVNYMIYGLTH